MLARVTSRFLLAALIVVAADVLTYDRPRGAGISAFALIVALGAILRWGRSLLRGGFWAGLWAAVAIGASVEGSRFSLLVLVTLGWAVLAMAAVPEAPTLFEGAVRGIVGGFRSFTAAPSDLRRAALIGRRRSRLAPMWVYVGPAAIVLLFACLIIPANAVLVWGMTDALDWLREALRDVTVLRTLFWAAVGLGGYGILRFRLGWRPSRLVWPREPEPPDGATERNVYFACILTLAGLNALYLAANAADGAYLWLSATLPEGVTYAQYAHQGSYRLIAAVVLAAITVVAFFPAGSMQMNAAKTRGLIHLFLLQNLAVLAGAGRRLHLYVAEYGLTRFRVAVVFWLGLVAVGFVLIHLRVRGRRPVRFLLETNAASVAILLSLVSVLDIDGFIARWNVERYREGVQTRIDVPYLGLLGPGALPELARLETVAAERNDPACARQAHVVLERRLAEEREALSSWRSWTWRRRSAVRGVTDPPRRQ